MLEHFRQTLGSPVWQFVSVVLTLIALVLPFIAKVFPYNQAATWGQKAKYFLGVGLANLLSVFLLFFVVSLVGTTAAPPIIIKFIDNNPPQQASPILNATPSPHTSPTSISTHKVTPTSVPVPTQPSGGYKSAPTPKPTPKPTPSPTPPAYPRNIYVNWTTPCDGNNPSYIEGEVGTVETISPTEVIYYLTFFNNSDQNLGLNTYTMSLKNDSTGTYSQAPQPSVPINAHSSKTISYTFDNISITPNTNYTLSWDIAEGNVFTCAFPEKTLSY